MTVVEDTVVGGGFAEDKDGYSVQRRFIVSDIEGPPEAIQYIGINADKIPRRHNAHPSVPFIFCVHRSAEILDLDKIAVTCHYKRITRASERAASETAAPQISIGGSVVTKQTNIDKDGNVTELTRRGANGNPDVQKSHIAQIQKPQMVVRFQRKEPKSPFEKSKKYQGSVNKAKWGDGAPRTWLCTRLEGSSSDGGETYEVTYEFQYNIDTWDERAVVIGSDNLPLKSTDDPPPIEGFEIKMFRYYPEEEFDKLNLFKASNNGDGGITGI